MSFPSTMCCASPPVTSGVLLVVVMGDGVYPPTCGAGGLLKFGPTAQAIEDNNAEAAMNERQIPDLGVNFIRLISSWPVMHASSTKGRRVVSLGICCSVNNRRVGTQMARITGRCC